MKFPGIYGHENIKDRLTKAFEKDRIPSAYLFIGENGIGKGSLAKEYAQLINCDTHNICHTCNNCRLYDSGAHPDFNVIKRNGQFIRIKQIQELINYLNLKPAYAKKRVVLLKNVERMNQESANSFLKILEEPPLDTLLVLTSSDENLLLETIISRCQRVTFAPLANKILHKILEEKYGLQSADLSFVINYSSRRVRKDLVEKVSVLNELRKAVLDMLCSLHVESMVMHCRQIEQWVKKELHGYFLEFCATWIKDFIYLKNQRPEHITNQDILDEIDQSRLPGTQEQLTWAFDLTIETEAAIKANAGKVLALEALLIRLKQVFEGITVI